jgi:type I restriction enzyme S subunit
MREGWVRKDFGACLKLKSGNNLTAKKMNSEGNIPVYGGNGMTGLHDDYNLAGKNIIIGRVGAQCGNVRYVKEKIWLTDNAFYVSEFLQEFDYEFLAYLLNNVNLRSYARQAAQPVISNSSVKFAQLVFPKSLKEQKQIVAILDEAFEAIEQAKANIEKNIENAQELFQSKLYEVFSHRGEGWENRKLGEVCENLDRKRIPITKNKRVSGPIPYYGASGVVDHVADYIFNEDLLLVSEDGANLLARTYPIAFSISGKAWVNNHAHVLRFGNIASQFFVEYYLNSIKLDDYVSGMAQPKLNQRMLNSIPVPFPDFETQSEVVSQLDVLKEEIQNIALCYKKKIVSLEELKKSLIQKAFSGELTKNFNEEVKDLVAS